MRPARCSCFGFGRRCDLPFNHAGDVHQDARGPWYAGEPPRKTSQGIRVAPFGKRLRAAVYMRVSTRDQTLANQVPDLERLAMARGFAIAATYQDEESGVKHRPQLEQLLQHAKAHRFDVVLVWALDRLGRNMGEVVANVLELERIGVDVLSAREPWLDTTGPIKALLVSVFAWVAEQERGRLIERTMAGLARARAEGKQLGRPRSHITPVALERAIEQLRDSGQSPAQLARQLGVSRATFYRAIASQKRPSETGGLTPRNP